MPITIAIEKIATTDIHGNFFISIKANFAVFVKLSEAKLGHFIIG